MHASIIKAGAESAQCADGPAIHDTLERTAAPSLEQLESSLEGVYARQESKFEEGRLLKAIKESNAYGKKYGSRTWEDYIKERWPNIVRQTIDERIAVFTLRENSGAPRDIKYSQFELLTSNSLTDSDRATLIPRVVGLTYRKTEELIAEFRQNKLMKAGAESAQCADGPAFPNKVGVVATFCRKNGTIRVKGNEGSGINLKIYFGSMKPFANFCELLV